MSGGPAPAALVDAPIMWQANNHVRGVFSNGAQAVTADLYFGEGDLVDFVSGDRMSTSRSGMFIPQRWWTPVRDYARLDDPRLANYGEARWDTGVQGEFTYLGYHLDAITSSAEATNPPDPANALGWAVVWSSKDECSIRSVHDRVPGLTCVTNPDAKVAKSRPHLDLHPDDQAAEVESNEFCILESKNPPGPGSTSAAVRPRRRHRGLLAGTSGSGACVDPLALCRNDFQPRFGLPFDQDRYVVPYSPIESAVNLLHGDRDDLAGQLGETLAQPCTYVLERLMLVDRHHSTTMPEPGQNDNPRVVMPNMRKTAQKYRTAPER